MNEFSIGPLALAACVFAVSASAKLRSRSAFRTFRAALHETALVPDRLVPVLAVVLPCAEVVAAAGLSAAVGLIATAGPGAKPVAQAALVLAVMLTGALVVGVAVIMRRGTQARCACFGAGTGRPLGRVHLIRNVTLLAAIATGLVSSVLGHGHPAPAASAVAAAGGALAALVFIRWEELAELFAPIPSAHSASPATQHRHNRRPG